ncbi:cob(I)yrinic acid a,c-diamide adenosyltransferase [Brevibacillus daliensis]|uniref:cob(I)yrinic acid a,c-diamide adenosyltransferase n=1 Tax=Brevibacillus daliensis TaxID=2892995 RepID=UPI001E4C4AFF|nr:cob(I)yrinic acid a,c-diamide adenosyltransferase [Brevibacillus daliensis]
MSIYTKSGDKGTTALFDGSRVKKYDLRVDTYGTFDELNAQISVAAKFVTSEENCKLLKQLERKLFYLCAELATEKVEVDKKTIRISAGDVKDLENTIDTYLARLPKVKSFILPGSSKAGAFLHVARTVARRGERLLVQLADQAPIRKELLQFVNRLSDFLYTLAREEDVRQMIDTVTKAVTNRYLQHVGQSTIKLDLPFFNQLAEFVVEEAHKEQVPVTMAVVDRSGTLVFSYRMPDALLVSGSLAEKKAYTAVAMKSETHLLSSEIQPGESLYQLETSMEGKIVTFGGGFLIKNGDRIIGALGISGGSVEQDIEIGRNVLSRIEKR